MICTSCQADNPAHAKFCFNCGTALEAPPSEGPSEAPCRSCGSSLPVDARFCGYCGTPEPIASATAPEPAAPEPAPPPQPPPVPAPPPTAAAPPQPGAAAPPPESEDDEATVQRTLAEVVAETPIAATPGSLPRGKAKTEPAKVIASRTLAERLGRGAGAVEAGTYSKQGPSLRKSEGKRAPPPPPAIGTRQPIGAKAGSKVPPPPGKPPKPATARDLPRMSAIPAPPGVGAPSVRTRTKGKGRPAPPPGPVPMPVAAKRPVPAKPEAALREVAEPSGGAVPPAVARTVTERTPVDEGSPGLGRSTPSEAAAILAPVEGWPDITEELDEVRFSALQGVDDGVRDEVFALQRKYPGHPDVTELAAELNVELESTERAVPPSVEPPAAAAEAAPSEQESSEPTPSVDRSTMPPVIAPESGPLSGAPEPTGVQTSDELLDDDDMVFADLESSDSATDMALMDDVDLSDIEQTGPTPSPVDPSPPEPQRQFDDLDLDDEEQFDRTQMVRGLQPPAPFGGVQPPSREVFGEDADVDESSITLAPGMNEGTSVGPAPGMNEDTSVGPAPERNEGTNVGPVPGLDEGTNVGPVPGLNEGTAVGPAPGRSEGTSVTFAPGSALDDDEMGVTLPPGGMVIKDGQYVTGDDEPTYTGDGSLSDLGLEAEAEPPVSTPKSKANGRASA